MSTRIPEPAVRLACMAACLGALASYCALNQVDDSFVPRYVAIDLRHPGRAFEDVGEVGPSSTGLVRWSGRGALTLRPTSVYGFDVIKVKLAADCDGVPVALLLDGEPVETLAVTRQWRQFEVTAPRFGRSIGLALGGAGPCAVHLSRLSHTNVRGASTGMVEGYVLTDPMPYRSQPFAPSSLLLGAVPVVTFLALAAWPRRNGRARPGRALAAVLPGVAVLALIEAARALLPVRVVYPTAAYLLVVLAPPLVFTLVSEPRGVLRLLTRSLSLLLLLPGFLVAGAVRLVDYVRDLPAEKPGGLAHRSSVGRAGDVRLRELWLPALAGLLLVALFFSALLATGLRVPLAPGDGWLQNLPARHLLAEELRGGRLPLWNPYIFSGFPLLGDIQVGALYPLHWIAAALPVGVAFNLALMATLVLGNCFTYGLARSFRMPPAAALFSGLIYIFSGFALGTLGLTNMAEAVVWLPLALWMAHRFLTTGSYLDAGFLAVALALQFLAGHPQTSAYTLTVLGLLWATIITADRGPIVRARLVVGGLAAAVLLVILVLPQLVATAELSSMSRRVSLSFVDFAGGSLKGEQLIKAAIPYFLSHEAPGATWSLYLGLAALTLAVMAWFTRRRGDGVSAWGVGLVTGLFLAMAPGWPVVGRILYHVPVLNAFRMPRRWLIVVILAVAMLAGFAVTRILEAARGRDAGRTIRPFLASLAVVVALAAVAVLAHCTSPSSRAGVWATLTHERARMTWIALASLLAWPLLWRVTRGRPVAVYALFLLQLTELASFNRHAEWRLILDLPESFSDPSPARLEPASRRVLAEIEGTRQRVFTMFEKVDWGLDDINRSLDAFAPNMNLYLGVPNVTGYSPLGYRRYLDLAGINQYGGTLTRAAAARWSGDAPRLPDVLAAGWLVVPFPLRGALAVASPRPRRPLPFEELIPASDLHFSDADVPQSYLLPESAGGALTWRLESPLEVEALYLASASDGIASGTTVAVIEAVEAGGVTHRLPIRVGAETADWKAGAGGLTQGSVVLTGVVHGVPAHLYGTAYRPQQRVRLRELSLHPETPGAGIWIPRALAVTTRTGIVPLEAVDVSGDALHDFVLRRRPTAMPRAWFAPTLKTVSGRHLDEWLTGSPAADPHDPADVVLVPAEVELRSAASAETGRGSVAIETASAGRFVLRSTSDQPGWAVLSESWYPGWRARVDGGRWTEPLRAYGLVQAVGVPAGTHRIEFRYRPMHVYWSFAGPPFGLLLVGVGLRRRGRRQSRPGARP